MPQAAAVAIVSYLGLVGTTATVATAVISAAITIGISVGVSVLAQSLLGGQQPKPSDRQFLVRSTVSPRSRQHGRGRSAGTQSYAVAASGKFYRVAAHGHGQVDAVEKFFIDDREVTVDPDGYVTDDKYQRGGRSRVRIEFRDGRDDPAHYTSLFAASAEWTPDHLGKGVFHSLLTIEQVPQSRFLEMFPNAQNTTLKIEYRHAIIHDPRSGVDAWSDNAALCIRDTLTHPDIFGMAGDWIDDASFGAAADVCDEMVPLAAGGTEPRYAVSAVYTYDQRPADYLKMLLAACNGKFVVGDSGKMALSVGGWSEPEFTIDGSMIEGYAIDGGNDGPDVANTIRATFVSPDHGWTEQDADPWVNATDVALRGEKVGEAPLLAVPSHAQARRLMKQAAALASPQWRGQLACNLAALPVLSHRFVRIVIPDLGLDFTAEVESPELRMAEGNQLTGVTVSFVSMSAEAFAFTTDEEGRAPEPPPAVDDDVDAISPPQNITVDVENRGSYYVATIGWDEVPDWVYIEIQAKVDDSVSWAALAVSEAGSASVESAPLLAGSTYTMRARAVSMSRTSAWVSIGTVYLVAPLAPSAASVDLVLADATVGWTQPASPSASAARVYRGTTSVPGDAVLVATVAGGPGAALSYADTGLAHGQYWWFVEAVNVAGDASARITAGTRTVRGIDAAILAIPTLTAIYAPVDPACRKVERTSPTTTALDGDPVGSLVSLVGAKNFTAAADAGRPVLDTDTSGMAWVHFDGVDDGYAIAGTLSGVTHVVIACRTSDTDGVFFHHGGVAGTASPHIPVFQSGSAASTTTAVTTPSVKVNRGSHLSARSAAHTAMSVGVPVVITASGAALPATANPAFCGYGAASGQYRFVVDVYGVALMSSPSAGELADVEEALAALCDVTLP